MHFLASLPLFLLPALASPIYLHDLDPRNVNPAPSTPDVPVPLLRTSGDARTVFTVSMTSDHGCNHMNQMLFASHNTSTTGCLGTRGPAFGSMEVVLAVNNPVRRLCTARIYATADCKREVGVGDAVGPGEGVCIYPGAGQDASGWNVECSEAIDVY